MSEVGVEMSEAKPVPLPRAYSGPLVNANESIKALFPEASIPAGWARTLAEERYPSTAAADAAWRENERLGRAAADERVAIDAKTEGLGKALDQALPEPSMSPRPGVQCKACGELVPMTAPDYVSMDPAAKRPVPVGWMLVAFPYKPNMQRAEWAHLCPPCGKRVAEYIGYCCANPHARSGK